MGDLDEESPGTNTWETRAFLVDQKKDELNKDQWKLIRDHVHMNVQAVSRLTKELQEVKTDITKLRSGVKEFEQKTTTTVDKELGLVKKDLEEEKSQRATKDASLERNIAALTDRINATDALEETHHQKSELSIAAVKKENLEKIDMVTSRIVALEAALDTRIPSAIADVKSANQKLQVHVQEQIDALNELQETYKIAATDALSLEKRRREDGINELNDKFQRCLQEEKGARETRCNNLEESLTARIEAEKADRDVSVRALTDSINQERSKRELAIKTVEEFIEAALAEESNVRDAAHGELNASLNREKTAREAHRTSMQSLFDEERAVRENHIKELLAQHASAKDNLHKHFEKEHAKERSLREAAHADIARMVDGHHDKLKGLIDQESKSRASHLDDKIGREQAQREQMMKEMFDRCRAEGDAVLQGKIDNEVAARTASMEALRDLIETETTDREKDVDDLREMVGAEKKFREDHHAEFDKQFKRHLDEFNDHKDGIHRKVEDESNDRQALHETHAEHLKGLLESEKGARAAHHDSLVAQIEELRAMLTSEAEKRGTLSAEMRNSIDAIEEALSEGDVGGVESSGKMAAKSRTAAQPTSKRALVPVQKQLQSLEAKILQELGMESDAREAHRRELQDAMASELKTRDDYHGTLKEQLEMLHGKHSNFLDMLETEKRERAGHFDAHRDERDKMHDALHDKLKELHGKHSEQSKFHESFQDKVNKTLGSEIEKLRQFISAENSALEANAKTAENRLDSLRKDLSEGLAKEGALRERTSNDLRGSLCQRLDYLEAVLDGVDDTRSDVISTIRSPNALSFSSDKTNNFGKRVVTLQQRLDVLERRLRDDVGQEIDAREADTSSIREQLKEERQSREDLQGSVKSQFDKERDVRSACLKEESEQLGKEIEALRAANSKSFQDVEHREKALTLTIEADISTLKHDLEEEKTQRITADKALERSHIVLTERVATGEANNQTHQERVDLNLVGQKRDVKERHDLVLERIASLENHVGEALPAALTEMRDADNKMQQSIKDHVDALKAVQDAHRSGITDLISSERSTREEAIHNLQGHVANRFAEEKAHRDTRESFIQDKLNGRIGEEKEERDAALRSLGQTLTAERTKRDGQLTTMRDEAAANLADHAREVDAKHGEAKTLINREKELREAHRAEVLALLEDAKKNHASDVQDMKAQLDAAHNELKNNSEKERATVMAHVKESHSMLDDRCTTIKSGMEDEVKKRDAHLAKINQMLIDEKQARDAALSKHRGDHEMSVSQIAEVLRQEHASGLKRVESAAAKGHSVTGDAMAEATRRLEYVEAVIGERYFEDKQMKNLITIRQQLDVSEGKLRDELLRETKARETDSSELRQMVGEEIRARQDLEGSVNQSFAKERTDREKKISETMVAFKSAMISHFEAI
jgi:hypothetical protein